MEGSFPPPGSAVGSDLHRRRNSDPDSQKSDSVGTEWTDEKHNEYLQSMEASFVDQLYNSLDLHGSMSHKEHSSDPKSSRQMHVSTRIPSGQFKVLRDGCWTKINVRRGEPPSRVANDPRDISVNPWVRHYRSGHRHQIHQTVASHSLQGKAILDSKNPFHMLQPNPCHHDSADNNTEVTDQNFVDEDLDKEVASQTGVVDKIKTSVIASTSTDQVVPCREFAVTEDVENISSSVKD
ncbi:cold-regulated protein 27-like [Apium graveolens]|uniref:cold-regulated protein 27-like n=1 Tax=Apium graveolens TaxID=4045 RepID=UPI003D79F757